MLSDLIADRVVEARARKGWTRQDLARRCCELTKDSSYLTAASVGNLETGRRGSDGRRRRTISVDELVVLAAALGVAPATLIFPVGEAAAMELWPGHQAAPFAAWEWFSGERREGAHEALDEAFQWNEWAGSVAAITSYEMHRSLVGDLAGTIARAIEAVGEVEIPSAPPNPEKLAAIKTQMDAARLNLNLVKRSRRVLDLHRQRMSDQGLQLPDLPEGSTNLQDAQKWLEERLTYLTQVFDFVDSEAGRGHHE